MPLIIPAAVLFERFEDLGEREARMTLAVVVDRPVMQRANPRRRVRERFESPRVVEREHLVLRTVLPQARAQADADRRIDLLDLRVRRVGGIDPQLALAAALVDETLAEV